MKTVFVSVFGVVLCASSALAATTTVECDRHLKKSSHAVVADRNDEVIVKGAETASNGYEWTASPDLTFTRETPSAVGAWGAKLFKIEVINQVRERTKYTFTYKRSWEGDKAALAKCVVTVRRK